MALARLTAGLRGNGTAKVVRGWSSSAGGRAGAGQAWEEKAPGRPYCSLPVPGGACERAGEGLFTRASSDRTRGDDFKLKD